MINFSMSYLRETGSLFISKPILWFYRSRAVVFTHTQSNYLNILDLPETYLSRLIHLLQI